MIDSIGKITLYVNNQNEARDFWTEKMGFIVRLEQQMGADPVSYTHLTLPTIYSV